MLFFKIHLTPFQRQENILSILTATNSFFFVFQSQDSNPMYYQFPPLCKIGGSLFLQTNRFLAPCHTSREWKLISNSLKRPNPCNVKWQCALLVFKTHAGRITNWTVSCSAIWGKYVGILSRYEQSADNAVCSISGRRHQALSFGTNSDVFFEFGLDLREVKRNGPVLSSHFNPCVDYTD